MPDISGADESKSGTEAGRLGIEVLRLFQWRRIVLEGDGPGLTLAEAAAILGMSVGSVARKVKRGELKSFRDEHGRLRISPALGESRQDDLSGLWEEYKATRLRLAAASKESLELAEELAAAQEELGHSQRELTAMWRLLRSNPPADESSRETFLPPQTSEDERPRPAPTPEVARIQEQISDIREWARRRSRLWTRAG
jgi:hypothetical protein